MRPTEILKKEHRAIESMLEVLSVVARRLEQGEPVEPDEPEAIVNFLKTFADKCHHGKEEDLLFPALVEAGLPQQGGPVGVMLSEHDAGRNYIRQMTDALEGVRNGDKEAVEQFVVNALNYSGLLKQHIFKEDNILFPMADAQIDEGTQQRLLASFDTVEREKIGDGVHEELHQLLNRLRDRYIPPSPEKTTATS